MPFDKSKLAMAAGKGGSKPPTGPADSAKDGDGPEGPDAGDTPPADDAAGGDDVSIAEEVLQRAIDGEMNEELVKVVEPQEVRDSLSNGEVPAFATDEDIWNRAVEALDPDKVPDDLDAFLVLAHVYLALGGEVAGLDEDAPPDDSADGDQPDAKPPAKPPAAAAKPPAAPPAKGAAKPNPFAKKPAPPA